MSGKMPLKKWLVDGDVLYPDDSLLLFYLDDPVNEQKWIAMRQDLHDVFDGECRLLLFHAFFPLLSAGPYHFSDECHGASMTRLHCNYAGAYASAGERKVTDAIQRFVTNELVIPAKFATENIAVIEHHRILQRGAFDQTLGAKRVDFVDESKRPGSRQIAGKSAGVNDDVPRLPSDQRVRKLDRYVQLKLVARIRFVYRRAVDYSHRLDEIEIVRITREGCDSGVGQS